MSRMIREVGYDWFNYVIVEDVDMISERLENCMSNMYMYAPI